MSGASLRSFSGTECTSLGVSVATCPLFARSIDPDQGSSHSFFHGQGLVKRENVAAIDQAAAQRDGSQSTHVELGAISASPVSNEVPLVLAYESASCPIVRSDEQALRNHLLFLRWRLLRLLGSGLVRNWGVPSWDAAVSADTSAASMAVQLGNPVPVRVKPGTPVRFSGLDLSFVYHEVALCIWVDANPIHHLVDGALEARSGFGKSATQRERQHVVPVPTPFGEEDPASCVDIALMALHLQLPQGVDRRTFLQVEQAA